jgi:hypothetical protein
MNTTLVLSGTAVAVVLFPSGAFDLLPSKATSATTVWFSNLFVYSTGFGVFGF